MNNKNKKINNNNNNNINNILRFSQYTIRLFYVQFILFDHYIFICKSILGFSLERKMSKMCLKVALDIFLTISVASVAYEYAGKMKFSIKK